MTVERLLIVGAGNIGLHVAQSLEADGKKNRLKIIERNRVRAEAAADALKRTVVLLGDGLDPELLEEANVAGWMRCWR
jgi:trk system potassium uptake protein TrkA